MNSIEKIENGFQNSETVFIPMYNHKLDVRNKLH
jgi:hypothetical protein